MTTPQKMRVPRVPAGRKTIDIVAPMKSMNIRIGVRKPQIGQRAKMKLLSFVKISIIYLKKATMPTMVTRGMSLGHSFS